MLPFWSRFVGHLEAQLNETKRSVETANNQANREISSMLDTFSNKDSKNLDQAQVNTITEAYQQNKFRRLVDPLELVRKIDKLHHQIDELAVSVDAFLSESNAISHITVELS